MKRNKLDKNQKELVLVGILCLLLSLVIAGETGIYQEKMGEAYDLEDLHTNIDANSSGDMNINISKVAAEDIKNNDYDDISNKKFAWGFKRTLDHMPGRVDETIKIVDYDGYYMYQPEDVNDKVLYLTFDCGYDNNYTEGMLDILKRQKVKACFFVTQTFIRDNIELTKRMKEEGHIVGNHTVTHPSMPSLEPDKLALEIEYCSNYMMEATGYEMDPFLRPPKGEYSERTLQLTKDMGYKTIFWSMAYLDYDVNNQPGCEYVIKHFDKYSHSGAIILMHNISSSNYQALENVIINMKNDGYRFGTLDEIK